MALKKPKRGSNRVKGWIWGAINPLLGELERVHGFLARKNLTWRHKNRRPEFIHEVADYVDRNARLILADLCGYDETLRERIEECRERYRKAVSAADAYFTRLVGSSEFRSEVQEAKNLYEMAYTERSSATCTTAVPPRPLPSAL
jgi:hypothetical protein